MSAPCHPLIRVLWTAALAAWSIELSWNYLFRISKADGRPIYYITVLERSQSATLWSFTLTGTRVSRSRALASTACSLVAYASRTMSDGLSHLDYDRLYVFHLLVHALFSVLTRFMQNCRKVLHHRVFRCVWICFNHSGSTLNIISPSYLVVRRCAHVHGGGRDDLATQILWRHFSLSFQPLHRCH